MIDAKVDLGKRYQHVDEVGNREEEAEHVVEVDEGLEEREEEEHLHPPDPPLAKLFLGRFLVVLLESLGNICRCRLLRPK